MSAMAKLAALIFLMWMVQFALTYFQMTHFKKRVEALRGKGTLIVGKAKGRIREGCIIIMVLNKKHIVIEAEEMRGITVFNKFRKFPLIIGRSVDDQEALLEGVKNKQQRKAIIQALEGGKAK